MLEVGGDFYLANEPVGAEHRGELGMQDLYRNFTIVFPVVGEIDGGHSAAPELVLDRVGGETALNMFNGFRHTILLSPSDRNYGGALEAAIQRSLCLEMIRQSQTQRDQSERRIHRSRRR